MKRFREFKREFREQQSNIISVELVFNKMLKTKKYSIEDFNYHIIPAIRMMRKTDYITLYLDNTEDICVTVYKLRNPTRRITVLHKDNTYSSLHDIPINQLFAILKAICIDKKSYIDIRNNNYYFYNRRPN